MTMERARKKGQREGLVSPSSIGAVPPLEIPALCFAAAGVTGWGYPPIRTRNEKYPTAE